MSGTHLFSSGDLFQGLKFIPGHLICMIQVNHSLMKEVIIIPCSKTIDTAGVRKLFFQNVFKQFHLHNTLISDRGLQFASALAKELARLI